MLLDDILSPVGSVAARAKQAAVSSSALVETSAVEATGKAAKVTENVTGRSPAVAAVFLALASLGGIVAMRRVFAGAIS